VEQLKRLIIKDNSSAKIEIDGGVNMKNARMLLDAGADVLRRSAGERGIAWTRGSSPRVTAKILNPKQKRHARA
jgi:hypothetical protein